jgi:hypothetical protein
MNWLDVVDWEGMYKVSSCGEVLSLSRTIIRTNGRPCTIRERILKQNLNSGGYPCVTLQRIGKKFTYPVYQLVAWTFLGPCPKGMEILHGSLGRLVSDISNLSYGTHQKNSLDMLRDNTCGAKPVTYDGRQFPSINQLANHLGVDVSGISKALHSGWRIRGIKPEWATTKETQ